MIGPGLLSGGAKVALRFPCAGSRVVPLLITSPVALAAIRPLAVHRHVSKTKTAVTPTSLRFPADPTGVVVVIVVVGRILNNSQ